MMKYSHFFILLLSMVMINPAYSVFDDNVRHSPTTDQVIENWDKNIKDSLDKHGIDPSVNPDNPKNLPIPHPDYPPTKSKPKPLPKPPKLPGVGGVVGGVVGEVVIGGVDDALDWLLDPDNHVPERLPMHGCGHNYTDAKENNRSFDEYPSMVCSNETRGFSYSIVKTVEIKSGIGKTYYMQCSKGYTFKQSCYAEDFAQDRPDSTQAKPDDNTRPNPPFGSLTPDGTSIPDNLKSGTDGKDGTDVKDGTGTDGKPGTDGKDGTGTDGKDGTDVKDGTDGKDGTDSKPFELPAFCEWASWFCSDELENPNDTKVEVQQEELTSDKVNINFGGSCPAGNSFGFNIGGARFTFTLSYEHVCKIAQSMGVLVRILSTIVAVYIIAGIKGG